MKMMRNVCILSFLFFYQMLCANDCETYYKTNLLHLSIDGTVIEKKEINDKYVIILNDKDNKQLKVELLKSTKSRELFLFLRKDSRIIKQKETLYFRVINMTDVQIDVKHFDGLC